MQRERQGVTTPLESRARHTMMQLIAAQIGVSLAIAAVIGAVFDAEIVYSALVGILIGVVPNYYFAARLARRRVGVTATQSLHALYVGEFIKIAFTSALFVIAIMLLSINFVVVVLGYLAVVMVNWAALLVINLGERGQSRVSVPDGAESAGGQNTELKV